MPSLSVYNIIRIYSKVEDYETENKTCVDTLIWARENGGSVDFNLLQNSAVDENWVCRHHLLQFIFGKWCSSLCKLFVNGKFTKCFYFLCARIDLFITFVCSLYSPWATVRLLHHFGFVYVLILGYAVHIFHANDAKYILFCIGWRKSLIGSATPEAPHIHTLLFENNLDPCTHMILTFPFRLFLVRRHCWGWQRTCDQLGAGRLNDTHKHTICDWILHQGPLVQQ